MRKGNGFEGVTRKRHHLEGACPAPHVDTDEAPEPLGEDELRTLQAHVREVIETGDPPARKALLQALFEEICVVSRAEI